MSRSSSSLNLAMPARSSSVAIQYEISYSFPSSKGPTFRPASWISGQLRLHSILIGVLSKVKSTSLMDDCGFVVKVGGLLLLSKKGVTLENSGSADLRLQRKPRWNLEDYVVYLRSTKRA